jgi:regulator of protease activity HflC (stomatin/prohibitin superfamily)
MLNVRNTYFTPDTPLADIVIPFLVTKVDFRKPELPKSIQQAITEKFAKQQESEAMAFVIAKERQEAERKSIEAQGIADFQRIVTEGINENLLYWRYIEVMRELAGSNNTTYIFAPDGRENPFMTTLPLESNGK